MNLTQSNNPDVAISAYGTARSTVKSAPPILADCARSTRTGVVAFISVWVARLVRISHEELEALFVGYGYTPYFLGRSPISV
ncbi:MAG: hypothetical protein JO279_10075 [Verrucomicrobia bacterium]|nr:hypothetical protein [Verrucomicrobiota bacterium]